MDKHTIITKAMPDRFAKLRAASDAYYNTGTPIMTDDEYDSLRDELEKLDPTNSLFKEIGALPGEADKVVTLPTPMASLNKIKPGTGAVASFASESSDPGSTWVITDKLDGISALWYMNRLYLRGDGILGLDVSHVTPYIQGLAYSTRRNGAIRGELIVLRQDIPTGTIARSWVNGQLHHKTIQPAELKKIHFVAYDVINLMDTNKSKNNVALTVSEALDMLQEMKFEIPWKVVLTKDKMTDEYLSALLISRREKSLYDTDGLVVAENVPRREERVDSHGRARNPRGKVAFKMLLSEQCAITKIVNIEWNASAHGFMIPRIQVEPVVIGSARIEYVTGHNARFIVKNMLGPGATIEIKRSGDVIPAVERVITPSAVPYLPKQTPYKWAWNGSAEDATHIVLAIDSTDAQPKEVSVAWLVRFAKYLGLVGFGPGVAGKLVEADLISPAQIIGAGSQQLSNILGKTNGPKILSQLQDGLAKATELELMVASNCMPRGVSDAKLKILFALNPDPRRWATYPVPSGWSKDSFKETCDALNTYATWRLKELPGRPYPIIPATVAAALAPVVAVAKKGTVCFTGVRSKDLETQLERNGWTVVPTVSSKLSVLVVPSDTTKKETTKVVSAREAGVRILPIDSVVRELALV